MEHKLRKNPLRMMHTVCDDFEERAMDMDIILPDYCPKIAVILKCTITPLISRCYQSGDRYSVEGISLIRIMYLSDDRVDLQCYEASEPFAVSFCVENGIHYEVTAKPDYVNCRAISAGRMDVHGAFRVYLKAVGVTELTTVAPECSQTICCKTSRVVSTVPVMQIDKSFSVSETLPLGADIDRIIYSDAAVVECEHKALNNKAIVKGKLKIRLVVDKNGVVTDTTELIPFSQIVDIEGLCDDWSCRVKVNVGENDIRTMQNENSSSMVSVCVKLLTTVWCYTDEYTEVVLDAYSVTCPLLCETTNVIIPQKTFTTASEHTVTPLTVELPDNIQELVDVWGDVRCETASDQKTNCVYTIGAFVRDSDGHISYLERVVDDTVPSHADERVTVHLHGLKGMISGDHLHIQAEITLSRETEKQQALSVVSEMIEDTQNPFSKTGATIRVVYAEKGDSVWNIAKEQHAVVNTILAENDLESDEITAPTVLLIPV